jgi:hypothetical protein
MQILHDTPAALLSCPSFWVDRELSLLLMRRRTRVGGIQAGEGSARRTIPNYQLATISDVCHAVWSERFELP